MITAEDIKAAYDEAYNLRDTRKAQWSKCLYHCIPSERYLVYDNVRMEQSGFLQPMSPVGIASALSMAAGIYSYMVANIQRLFAYRTSDPELNKDDEVKEYLAEKSRITLKYLQNSNFSSTIFDNILHGPGVVGTDLFLQEWCEVDEKLKYRSIRAWDCCILENKHREVDEVYWRDGLTAKQAVAKFGYNKCSKDVQTDYDTPGNQLHVSYFICCVKPRDGWKKSSRKQMKKRKKYAMYWVDEKDMTIVLEDGFDVFPFHVARGFLNSDSPYGRSRAEDSLSALAKIDRGERMIDDHAELSVNKPIWMPSSAGDGRRIRFVPGAINYYNSVTGADVPQTFDTGDEPEALERRVDKAEQNVKDMFFVDLFRVLADRVNMTAEEVRERIMESIQGVSPVVTEYEKTTLTTSILHADYLLSEAGKFDHLTKPANLKDGNIEIYFTTRLDFKLREIDTDQLIKTVNQALELFRARAEAEGIDNILNLEKAVREIAYANGVDPELVYTEIEAKKRREAEAAAIKQEAMTAATLDKVGQFDPMVKPEGGSMAEQMQSGGGLGSLIPNQ